MPALTSLALGASAIGGIANAAANMSAADRAAALQDKGLQEWLRVNIPDPAQQRIAMERFVQQGELVPQIEKAISQDPTAFEKITTDPALKQNQLRALQELEQIGFDGGLRLQDKAALQDAMMKSQVKERADRDAIAAEMARRGQSGSGFAFAAQLAAQQGAADRAAQNSLSVAAQAQDRALQSIMQGGELAGKIRGQDYEQQAQLAQARDSINRFNTQNLQDIQQRNIASQNRAREMNLGERQRIADANTNLSNQEQKYNKELIQQQFDNQAKVAAGRSGQYGQMGANELRKGEVLGNTFTNFANAASGVATAKANQDFWSDYLKKK